jgi:hypothetical protein
MTSTCNAREFLPFREKKASPFGIGKSQTFPLNYVSSIKFSGLKDTMRAIRDVQNPSSLEYYLD